MNGFEEDYDDEEEEYDPPTDFIENFQSLRELCASSKKMATDLFTLIADAAFPLLDQDDASCHEVLDLGLWIFGGLPDYRLALPAISKIVMAMTNKEDEVRWSARRCFEELTGLDFNRHVHASGRRSEVINLAVQPLVSVFTPNLDAQAALSLLRIIGCVPIELLGAHEEDLAARIQRVAQEHPVRRVRNRAWHRLARMSSVTCRRRWREGRSPDLCSSAAWEASERRLRERLAAARADQCNKDAATATVTPGAMDDGGDDSSGASVDTARPAARSRRRRRSEEIEQDDPVIAARVKTWRAAAERERRRVEATAEEGGDPNALAFPVREAFLADILREETHARSGGYDPAVDGEAAWEVFPPNALCGDVVGAVDVSTTALPSQDALTRRLRSLHQHFLQRINDPNAHSESQSPQRQFFERRLAFPGIDPLNLWLFPGRGPAPIGQMTEVSRPSQECCPDEEFEERDPPACMFAYMEEEE